MSVLELPITTIFMVMPPSVQVLKNSGFALNGELIWSVGSNSFSPILPSFKAPVRR
jgi:hypothetical protein